MCQTNGVACFHESYGVVEISGKSDQRFDKNESPALSTYRLLLLTSESRHLFGTKNVLLVSLARSSLKFNCVGAKKYLRGFEF